MNYIDIPKQACFTPLYSPRTSLSNINQEMDKLTTNLAINIDKYILGFFKDAFQQNNNQLTLNQFVSHGLKHLKSWQRELKFRQEKIYQCLYRLFQEGDNNRKGVITWTQFNSMLIEKGLNLKSLRNHQPGNTALMKSIPVTGFTSKYGNPIQKMVSIGNKIAIFTQQGSQVDFFNPDGSPSNLKSLILSQQSLTVQTYISKRAKGGIKETVKKVLVVAQYKNVLLDMIYINDSKYDMLITSSTDFMIKGWDISSNTPILAKQPENEDQKMQHQFPVQIHTMAWDNVNEILYCCGKTPKIYEWMVKTDSQRELFDPDGHTQMISAMIMMPKLQFLATGGYDGKLILWDTISQTKKFKYKQHTRSISSMAFHQGLILLFTAAYDHSICVWNPYIQSLIHKIINNVNVIQLDIIPETNMLLALDAQANVKIREINKFTLVSSFSIDKHQHKIQPVCMISTTNPLKYFFAGLSVSAYEYIHVDANVILDSTALCLKYQPSSFHIYCPIKNHIIAWSLLTGNISSTLRNQTSGQIIAFDIFVGLKLAVIGDIQGNLLLRKLQNGVLVKKLYKHKTNVTSVLTEEIKNEKIIFSASYDGEIAIFERDNNGDFNFTRTVSIKKMNGLSNITSLCFQHKRNTLAIGTNFGQIFFLDIDKNKMISKCQTQAGDIEKFVLFDQDNILLSFTKKAEIFGLYLPPHIKKFKSSCHLVSEQQNNKVSSIAMSTKNKRCYIGFQNGDLMCFWLNEDVITDAKNQNNQNSTKLIRHIWKNNFAETIRNIILIQSEDVLVIIIGANTIMVVGCENGLSMAEFDEKYNNNQPTPILFLDDQNNSIYIKSHDTSIPVKITQKEEEIKRVFDPMFYINMIGNYQQKINLVSNTHWKFNPKIDQHIHNTIQQSMQLVKDIEEYEKQPKKLVLVKAESQPSFDLRKAIQLQKKWERQKEDQDSLRNTKQQSLHHAAALSTSNLRVSKFGSLSKTIHRQQKYKQQIAFQNTSPLYRLGAALKSLNEKDTKAQRLLDMAQKQLGRSRVNLKLPKIATHKDQ